MKNPRERWARMQIADENADESGVCRIIRRWNFARIGASASGVARTMRVTKFSAWMIGGLSLFLFTPAFAQELSDEAVPDEWIADYITETLHDLKYPEYYNDLDKAREQVYRG